MKIISIKKISNKSKRYDIETDSGNFYANDILVHNCSSSYFSATNKRFGFKKKIFGVCSRTQWKKAKDSSIWWKLAEQYNLEKILKSYKHDILIQGEASDTKVQKNKYKFTGPRFFVFNVVDLTTGKHFNVHEMEEFCKLNGLDTVPVLDREFKLLPTSDEMLAYCQGKSVLNPAIEREGVVVRCMKDGKKVLSFKCINNKFLLKYDGE